MLSFDRCMPGRYCRGVAIGKVKYRVVVLLKIPFSRVRTPELQEHFLKRVNKLMVCDKKECH